MRCDSNFLSLSGFVDAVGGNTRFVDVYATRHSSTSEVGEIPSDRERCEHITLTTFGGAPNESSHEVVDIKRL